ncbi:MAG TPA: nuclear transport factor 2 family protein [Microthrixaceae bacterium]|nr:nuclear transport factor 2 family protein [Microthrixaceae bacterium]
MTTIDDSATATDGDTSARAASLRSRAAVAAKDRSAWVGLFAPDAIVQDPVGPSAFDESGLGHRGIEAIVAFWDNVIAPNSVAMRIEGSYAGLDEVANVVTITTSFDDGSQAIVPGVVVYKVNEVGLIVSLRAFWEMEQMSFVAAPA